MRPPSFFRNTALTPDSNKGQKGNLFWIFERWFIALKIMWFLQSSKICKKKKKGLDLFSLLLFWPVQGQRHVLLDMTRHGGTTVKGKEERCYSFRFDLNPRIQRRRASIMQQPVCQTTVRPSINPDAFHCLALLLILNQSHFTIFSSVWSLWTSAHLCEVVQEKQLICVWFSLLRQTHQSLQNPVLRRYRDVAGEASLKGWKKLSEIMSHLTSAASFVRCAEYWGTRERVQLREKILGWDRVET